MTADEVKRAFMNASRVVYQGRRYPYINALICRRSRSGKIIQAELLDTRSSVNCVYIVSPEQLEWEETK